MTRDGIEALIVDDDSSIRYLLVMQLNRLGIKADTAFSGMDAVRRIQTQHYQIILMDLNMPDMNGYEAAAAIREYEKLQGSKSIPIIAITSEGDKKLALSSGMNDYYEKPVLKKELRQLIIKWRPDLLGSAN